MNEIISTTGETTELATSPDFDKGMAFLNPAEMPDLDTAEVGMSIEPKYYEFANTGDTVRAIFNGVGHITKKDPDSGGYINQPAVVFQNKDGVYLHAGANLIQQLQNVPPGTAIQITFSGKEKTNGGYNVNKFDVRLLNVARVNVPAVPARPQIAAPAQQEVVAVPTHQEPIIWSVSQKQALIDAKYADSDFSAKGMLGLSNLPEDATPSEILHWGKVYRERRTSVNPDTGKVFTAPQAAEYANSIAGPMPF